MPKRQEADDPNCNPLTSTVDTEYNSNKREATVEGLDMDIPLQPEERDILIQTMDEYLDAAPEVEQEIWRDKYLQDPNDTLACITDHQRRTHVLQALRERLQNAA